MSAVGKPRLDLQAFAEVFEYFDRESIAATVIGGCAVGAYAGGAGITVLSGDLDALVSAADQRKLRRVSVPGVTIRKLPQPRSTSTLVIDWRGLEVDALVESTGPLPDAKTAFSSAWTFAVGTGLARVLDPFALLQNKLGVNREKDRPHIAIMTTFLREHALALFLDPALTSRARLEPAQRLVALLGEGAFPVDLFALMIASDLDASARRFLAHNAPNAELARMVIDAAPERERDRLRKIRSAVGR